jgi:hypothetical protein
MKYIIGFVFSFIVGIGSSFATPDQARFEREIDRSSEAGTVLIYQCKRPNGIVSPADIKRALQINMIELSNSNDEKETARQLGCLVMSDNPLAEYAGVELYDGPYNVEEMTWYTGEVVESQPETTGYNFPGIIRIPNQKNSGSISHPRFYVEKAWKVDKEFYDTYFTREIDAANPDDVGYFTCASQRVLLDITNSSQNIPVAKRSAFITGKLKASGCRERRGKLHDIKAIAVTQADSAKWYQITAMEGSDQVAAMLWMWN